MKKVKGWKNTNKDFKCRDLLIEVGKTYKHNGEIELCSEGFHFHENRFDIFKYYNDRENPVFEIEAINVITGDDKSVCSEMKIIKQLSKEEVEELCNLKTNTGMWNSGNWNSGDWNSGNWNSGYRNSGYRNSGDSNSGNRNSGNRNSGNMNSGDWNSGYRNSGDSNSGNLNSGNWNSGNKHNGCFNTKEPKTILIFDKSCNKEKWDNSQKPNFLYFNITEWISEDKMSDQEKLDNPKFFCAQGYLKTLDYKKAFQKSFDNRENGELELLEALPNFNWKKFTEISGIKKPKKGKK